MTLLFNYKILRSTSQHAGIGVPLTWSSSQHGIADHFFDDRQSKVLLDKLAAQLSPPSELKSLSSSSSFFDVDVVTGFRRRLRAGDRWRFFPEDDVDGAFGGAVDRFRFFADDVDVVAEESSESAAAAEESPSLLEEESSKKRIVRTRRSER